MAELAQIDERAAMELKRRALAVLSDAKFRPAWWLPNRHLQTLWAAFCRRAPRVDFTTRACPTRDDDVIYLHELRRDPRAPRVLIVPGLESSARSPYARATAAEFARLGWSVSVMEHRGCSRELNRNRRLYHSGATDDVDDVARFLASEVAPHPLYLVGFSLGGNMSAKWLGERGAAAPVRAAALVALPFDLAESAAALNRSLFGLYSRYFARTLRARALAKERQFPGCVDVARLRQARTIIAFDDAATAPLHGFRDAQDYYEKCSCGPYLDRIRVPTLLIASEDDPYNPASTLPRELAASSAWLIPLFTRKGGHQGFVTGPWPWRALYWAEEQVVRFLMLIDAQSQAQPDTAAEPRVGRTA